MKEQSAVSLNQAAAQALAAGRFEDAQRLFESAIALDPASPILRLNLAGAYRARGDLDGALASVEEALKLQPRFFLALLMKGSLLERLGRTKEAAHTYCAALLQVPAEASLDQTTRQALAHARALTREYARALDAFLRGKLGSAIASGTSPPERRRVETFLATTLGAHRIYRQEPTDFYYPELPAIPFWDREEFPWLLDLEQAMPEIRQEAMAAIEQDCGFEPYLQYPDSAPLDQWRELNRSLRWSAFHFYHFGKRYEDNCQRCPKTIAALSRIPQPWVSQRMPAAMFSVLRPKTRIPPHTGVANIRLVVHLPLIVPPGCGFRVGHEVREWREGQAWVFDDTIEHEAWNDSEQIRVILICDVWNPRLSPTERDLIRTILESLDEFNGFVTQGAL